VLWCSTSALADAKYRRALLALCLEVSYNDSARSTAMVTNPDLPTPITADPPDVPELPVEPDKGPSTPPGSPTDPESPFTVQPK
jgi:hypothetical protein